MEWRKQANDEEKIFLQQLTGAQHKSEKQYRCFTTDFYSKEWIKEVTTKYLGQDYYSMLYLDGGYCDAERQLVIFGYEDIYGSDCPIVAIEVNVKVGIGKPLGHRDYLGALLGLGIERSKIGDIVVKPQGAYVIIKKELEEYIRYHLIEIGRYTNVSINTIAFTDMKIEAKQYKEILGTVQSLRADAVFALAFGLSRSTAVKLLQQEKGRCNGMIVKASDLLKVGDIGTLKGFGKMHFAAINGMTKKDRTHIKIEKYI